MLGGKSPASLQKWHPGPCQPLESTSALFFFFWKVKRQSGRSSRVKRSCTGVESAVEKKGPHFSQAGARPRPPHPKKKIGDGGEKSTPGTSFQNINRETDLIITRLVPTQAEVWSDVVARFSLSLYHLLNTSLFELCAITAPLLPHMVWGPLLSESLVARLPVMTLSLSYRPTCGK